MVTPAFVTAQPWAGGLQHPTYGTADTYQLAAGWLSECPDVADWGGGAGAFGPYLPPAVRYRVVDGTLQSTDQHLVDLRTFTEPASGILIRHVLELNSDWRRVLRNALASFRQRMAVVTFTPDVSLTCLHKMKSGWPVMHFDPRELRFEMGRWLVRDEMVPTSHPERIYYLERGR